MDRLELLHEMTSSGFKDVKDSLTRIEDRLESRLEKAEGRVSKVEEKVSWAVGAVKLIVLLCTVGGVIVACAKLF